MVVLNENCYAKDTKNREVKSYEKETSSNNLIFCNGCIYISWMQ